MVPTNVNGQQPETVKYLKHIGTVISEEGIETKVLARSDYSNTGKTKAHMERRILVTEQK